jgi:hypothetical protein
MEVSRKERFELYGSLAGGEAEFSTGVAYQSSDRLVNKKLQDGGLVVL